jgi:transposase-like protein
MSLADAAREFDVSPATLRRWVSDGLVPLADGDWTRGSLSHARGQSLARIEDAEVELKGFSRSTELFLAQRVRA